MRTQEKLSELILKAQKGDVEALSTIIQRFTPLIKKYSRLLGDEDANSDLTLWIIDAIKRYRPNTAWGKVELENYLTEIKEKEKLII